MGELEYVPLSGNVAFLPLYHSYAPVMGYTESYRARDVAVFVGHGLNMLTEHIILAWEIPWTEEPGRLQSMGSLRVGHD